MGVIPSHDGLCRGEESLPARLAAKHLRVEIPRCAATTKTVVAASLGMTAARGGHCTQTCPGRPIQALSSRAKRGISAGDAWLRWRQFEFMVMDAYRVKNQGLFAGLFARADWLTL